MVINGQVGKFLHLLFTWDVKKRNNSWGDRFADKITFLCILLLEKGTHPAWNPVSNQLGFNPFDGTEIKSFPTAFNGK